VQSIQIPLNAREPIVRLHQMTVRTGCIACQGPLLLAAFIAPALGQPAQHIYRCEACDHLEWIEEAQARAA